MFTERRKLKQLREVQEKISKLREEIEKYKYHPLACKEGGIQCVMRVMKGEDPVSILRNNIWINSYEVKKIGEYLVAISDDANITLPKLNLELAELEHTEQALKGQLQID